MPIKIKGQQTVKSNKEQRVKPSPAPARSKTEINPYERKSTMTSQERKKDINNDYRFDKNKTYLVVGGKVKEISSKSKYLLDMLIIEEEN